MVGVVVLFLFIGLRLGEDTVGAIPIWINLVSMPGTMLALFFPGVHSGFFISAVVLWNLFSYETFLALVLFWLERRRGRIANKAYRTNQPKHGEK